MNTAPGELFFLLDEHGSFIVFQENETAWAGLLAFSTEDKAREFADSSRLAVSDVAGVEVSDRTSLAALIEAAKKRAVRNLLLDLDYRSGKCIAIEFEGGALGPSREWQFAPRPKR